MVRKIFIVFLMAPLLAAAAINGVSLALLSLMLSLLFIALAESSARGGQQE
jgi:hypothetical protein